MRIQARLFLATAFLVLALMGVQWWLHARQLRALESELGAVAASVSKGMLTGDVRMVVDRFLTAGEEPLVEEMVWVHEVDSHDEHGDAATLTDSASHQRRVESRLMIMDPGSNQEISHHFKQIVRHDEAGTASTCTVTGAVAVEEENLQTVRIKAPNLVVETDENEVEACTPSTPP